MSDDKKPIRRKYSRAKAFEDLQYIIDNFDAFADPKTAVIKASDYINAVSKLVQLFDLNIVRKPKEVKTDFNVDM